MPTPRRSLWPLALVTAGAALGLGASCDRRPPQRPSASADARANTPAEQRPSLTLYFLTELDGYLEPCGCQTRPLGGIDRVAHAIASERDRTPGSILVAAGDLFFEHPEVEERMVFQERARAESMARILDGLHLAAYAPGPADFALGADAWRALSSAVHAPALAANAGMTRSTIREVAGARVGIVGVSDFAPSDGARAAGAPESTDGLAATRDAVAEVRRQGASVVVVLASVAPRVARSIASEVEGVDFVIAARHEGATAPPPERVGRAFVLTAPNQAKGLGAVDLWLRGDGPMRDASDASAVAERARLDARITELNDRIAAWSEDPSVDRAAVEAQRRRLASLSAQRAQLDQRAVPTDGRFFRARTLEISPDVAKQPSVQSQIASYFRAVNEHNRVAYADLRAPPAPPGTARYLGVEACRDCHEEAYAVWARTPHHSAYRTLEDISKNFNLACVGCHVTGYRQPGGSEVVQNEGLRDVQCETCHGPGSLHVAARGAAARRATIRRDAPATFCATQCHTPEHSDHFDYATYLPRILGPGHGRPVDEDAGVAADAAPAQAAAHP
ncbi:MAG: multiheme c-type cytochrome [Polyangiales bacterium]